MKLHILKRTHNETGKTQVLCGSSMVTNKPYWYVPGEEATLQPLLFRDPHYAEWCMSICKGHDTDASEVQLHKYSIGEVEL